MIVDRKEMQNIEQSSGLDVLTLMEHAGEAIAEAVSAEITADANVLILCGKGNNGGDGLVVARLLQKGRIHVYLAEGEVKTEAAKHNLALLSEEMLLSQEQLQEALNTADIILDCVYGFSYHGALRGNIPELFRKVNASGARIFSVDINSGCEADTGRAEPDAIVSEITYALDCYKPFHMLRKDHQKFKRCVLLSLHLPHPEDASIPFKEMDEQQFFASFAKKNETSYKNSFGQMLITGGSMGMAGAVCLNILGAKTVGASYIHAAVPDPVYPICAGRFLTPVYHPVNIETCIPSLRKTISSVRSIVFGSGSVSFPQKDRVLELILQDADCPVVLDAEALRILRGNEDLLRPEQTVIVTPHIGEFAYLSGLSRQDILADRIGSASVYAKMYHVIVVLKGPHTIVASPDGEIYINQSGCEALAQAGSGDLLAGMIGAVLLHQKNPFKAVCMAVWLHGFLSEPAQHNHSLQTMPLEDYPCIMDQLFRKHGF